jgi:hypothetical protein
VITEAKLVDLLTISLSIAVAPTADAAGVAADLGRRSADSRRGGRLGQQC